MAISDVTKSVAIAATTYLNHPSVNGISSAGNWYTYIPETANNRTAGASIVPYGYDSALDLVNTLDSVAMEGTIPLVKETWGGTTRYYHGGCIENIGAGTNDITNATEDQAFFFAHLGNYDSVSQVSDDGFWWDRLYDETGVDAWDYYQYHVHYPALYPNYNDARLVMNGNGFIVPTDKSFAYQIQIRVKQSGTFYSNVLARVHTPSVGGAHNSHNDVIMGDPVNANYLLGGIIQGTNDRYHSFFLDSAGVDDWRVCCRTYTDTTASFTALVDLGTYDLADPVFNFQTDYTGDQGEYPFRASCAAVLGGYIYIPVIYNGTGGTYDLKIWKIQESTVLSASTLSVQDFLSGLDTKPDCQIRTVGSNIELLTANDDAQIKLYSSSGDGTFTDEGTVVANNSGSTDNLRIHGFRYNPFNTKYYALISGDLDAGGTYTGQGLYSFSLGGVFAGYPHLDYDSASGSFLARGASSAGYLSYDHTTGVVTRINSTEPEGIAVNTSILIYDENSPVFYDKREILTKANDVLFDGEFLKDGRKIFVGHRENKNPTNTANLYDILVSVSENASDEPAVNISWGGDGADWPITVIQDSSDRIWIAGYTKSELVPKRDIWVHGWARNLNDSSNTVEWKDHVLDNNGNIYVAGNHVEYKYPIVAKYDYNFDIQWQRYLDIGQDSDTVNSIAIDASNNLYLLGDTFNNGQGGFDAQLIKVDSTGDIVYVKSFGTAGLDEHGTSVDVIVDSSLERVVMSVTASGQAYSTLLVSDLDGVVERQVRLDSCVINRVRRQETRSDGRFMFAGTDGSTSAKFGLCDINETNLVQWNQKYSTASASANDILMWSGDSASVSVDDVYIVAGQDSSVGFVMQMTVDSTYSTFTKNWATLVNNSSAIRSIAVSPFTIDQTYVTTDESHHYGRFVYAVGYTDSVTTSPYANRTSFISRFDSVGAMSWENNFGHMGNDNLYSISRDVLDRNLIFAGSSTSHSNGRDAVLFRADGRGFGLGSHYTEGSTSASYYYERGTLSTASNVSSLINQSAPADIAGSQVTATDVTNIAEVSTFTTLNYDGAYGSNGVFQGFLAEFKLDKFKEYLNGAEYAASVAAGNLVHRTSSPFEFYQVGTVGDGAADDGNIFIYDAIQHTNGKLYMASQTSGSVGRVNPANSGVYDYQLVSFNQNTQDLSFFQNGDSSDQEIYSLTELSNQSIAFAGRTTGFLGNDSNFGGYDVFLGIFNPNANHAMHGIMTHGGVDYYQTGTGLNDRGMELVDINDKDSDTLAIIGTTYGAFPNNTNKGSEDLILLKFNYVNDTWDSAYQFGSTTQDLIDQNSHPAAKLGDGRIAAVAHTAGIFADDGTQVGGLDIALAIIDPANGNIDKYTLGTNAADFSSAVVSNSSELMIVGFTEAAWEYDYHGVYSLFDTSKGFVGKNPE